MFRDFKLSSMCTLKACNKQERKNLVLLASVQADALHQKSGIDIIVKLFDHQGQ